MVLSKKMKQLPSIFNDVIGPIMRGPSSSHCAAAVRIGRIARDLMNGKLTKVSLEFDQNGSLASTHESQGSDMGIFGGLLGWEATDERLVHSSTAIRDADIDVDIRITAFDAPHPNTYRLKLINKKETHQMTAISTGGGMIEITEIDFAKVSLKGDYFVTLIFLQSGADKIVEYIRNNIQIDEIYVNSNHIQSVVQINAQNFLPTKIIKGIKNIDDQINFKEIKPVLPVLSRKNLQVPFTNCDELIHFNEGKDLPLWELALIYENARSGFTQTTIMEMMSEIVDIIKCSIQTGLSGTEYPDRILHFQSGNFRKKISKSSLFDAGLLNLMILYITALMETKSSMGLIVAAPTAGACGGLPGACIAASNSLGLDSEDISKAMLSAGLIGVFIAARATFAAEVGGCQAECGSGSGMAAAALVTMAGGTTRQALSAASMALQNILGMICDPVANRVEVPCLGKNILAASNALACANMSLANFDQVIPLDEVIKTMDLVGKSLPRELRCTALGGLSTTATSLRIEQELNKGLSR